MRPLAVSSVLVTTDLSEGSHAALAAAGELARLTGAKLTVLHVRDTRDAEQERQAVQDMRARVGSQTNDTDVRVLVGDAAETIVQQAQRVGADVIVLGPHRQRERTGKLGSTADQVVRHAQLPCLVVPAQLSLPLQRVLVPVDLTEAAYGALLVGFSWASALRQPARSALAQSTDVCILHVTHNDEDRTGARETLHQQVESIHSRVAQPPGVHIREVVTNGGDPAQTILQQVREEQVDLAVLSTRGNGDRDMLGSVSSAVVRQCPGPVLLVPPEVWRQHAAAFAA